MVMTRAEAAQYVKDAGGLKLLVFGAWARGRGDVRARIGDIRPGGSDFHCGC